MELIISVGFTNGNFSSKVESFEEATAVHEWLVTQGLLPDTAKAVRTVNAEDVDAKDVSTTQQANLDAQREAHEAALAEQAAANAQAEAAAAAAAKTIAKKAAADKKAAAAAAAGTPGKAADLPSVADVTKAVTDYAAKFGPTEARALFARFGVNRGGDLKPEQFEDFIALARDFIARDIKASDAVMPEGADLM